MTFVLEYVLASYEPTPKSKALNRSKSQPKARLLYPSNDQTSVPPLTTINITAKIDHIPSCPNKFIHDPLARKSDKKISSRLCRGDGDLWFEKECVNMKTGERMSFFYSAHTGRRVAHEPPSGATKVLYMNSHSVGMCPGCLELYRREKEAYQPRSLSPIKRTRI